MAEMTMHEMFREARKTLDVYTDGALATFLGISRRTVQRHSYNGGIPPGDLPKLVRALHARDPALAQTIARSLKIDLSDLAAAAKPAASTTRPTNEHVALMVLAACDALNMVPRDVRPALAAIFGQARSLGVDLDQLAKLLSEGEPAKGKKPPKP